MKRSLYRIIPLCLALFLCMGLLPSCSSYGLKKYTYTYYEYFDTFSTLTLYAKSQEEANAYETLARQTLSDYHMLLDRYRAYDGTVNLHTLNERAGGDAVTVDPRLFSFLSFAKDMYTLTEGKTNICLGSVLTLWHTERQAAAADPNAARLPDPAALAEARQHTSISDLILLGEETSVQLTDPQLSLDAGALGKGYAAERLKERLLEAGCTDFLINLGGNTVGVGQKPTEGPWLCAIENPTDGKGGFDGAIRLEGKSLVTTGSYHRYYTVDGKNYCHVIDTETGMPAGRYLSVSILTDDSGQADALSTALFCMDYEEGLRLIASMPDTEALWILSDGTVRMSGGFSSYTS